MLIIVTIVIIVAIIAGIKIKYEVELRNSPVFPTDSATQTPAPILEDPRYAIPKVGEGVKGEVDSTKAIDPLYFNKLFLPFIDEPNVMAGSGFAIEAKELPAGENYTAIAYPRDTSKDNPLTVELGKGTVDSSGVLMFDAALPTNLSLGSYTIEVSGPSKTFTTPFVIRPQV